MQSVLVSLENGTALVLPLNTDTLKVLEAISAAPCVKTSYDYAGRLKGVSLVSDYSIQSTIVNNSVLETRVPELKSESQKVVQIAEEPKNSNIIYTRTGVSE